MPEHVLGGIRYRTHPDVYEPHDDTELLLQSIDAQPGDLALEVGCGAGLVAVRLAQLGARVVACDLNPAAIELARENARINQARVDFVRTDLARALRLRRFDVVAFNPPYLPTDRADRLPRPLNDAFDGGAGGDETTLRFLDMCRDHPPGRVYLLGSSLQHVGVEQAARDRGWNARGLRTKKLSWETLTAYDLSAAGTR